MLDLIRELELQRIKEYEIIKEYLSRLLGIVNKVMLIVTKPLELLKKIIVKIAKRYEASITTLENTKDLFKITMEELLNALQDQKRRRLIRQDHIVERALLAKYHQVGNYKKRKASIGKTIKTATTKERVETQSKTIHTASTMVKSVICYSNVGRDQMQNIVTTIELDIEL